MDERSREVERRLKLPLLIFAPLTIPAILLEYADQQEPSHAIGIALNWSIRLAFVGAIVLSVAAAWGVLVLVWQ